MLLSPTVHPWYVLWAWVPALLCGVRSWTLLATLVPLSYAALASYDPTTSTWEEPWWPSLLSTLPFLMALIWESVQHATQPGPWPLLLEIIFCDKPTAVIKNPPSKTYIISNFRDSGPRKAHSP